MKIQCVLMLEFLIVMKSLASIDFIVVGDWGGMPIPPYKIPGQVSTAAGMDTIAKNIKPAAVFALGDNFYFDGVLTTDSPRFEQGWNEVYSAESLQVPWYFVAGNHDHYGNVSAQVAYTEIDPTDRWNFPDLYHVQSFSSPATNETAGFSVDVIFIDTVDLSGSNGISDESDPRYFDPLPYRPRSAAAEQWDWIEEQLKSSTANYLLVAGHFPVYSVCEHGPTSNLVDNLEPLLVQYGAHYLAGHDHCLESFHNNGVQYMVSGTGDTCCTDDSHLESIPEGSLEWYVSRGHKPDPGTTRRNGTIGGFSSIEVKSAAMYMHYYDQDGQLLYTTPSIAPRQL